MELLQGTLKTKIAAVEVVHLPYRGDLSSINAKTKMHYSGGGYILVELLLEKILGQSFEAIAKTYLFDVLGMNKSTFEQNDTDSIVINSIKYPKAEGYDQQGQPTREDIRIFPAKSMAGLWTTPTDIAKMALALNNSLRGAENHYLSKKMAKELLRGAGQKAGDSQAGLGVFSNGKEFDHSGFNPGFWSYYSLDRDGNGFVSMINSSNGLGIFQDLRHAADFTLGKITKLPKYQIDLSHEDVSHLVGSYYGNAFKLSVELRGNQLFVTLFPKGSENPFMGSPIQIYPISRGKFVANTVLPFPIFFKFSHDKVVVEHKEGTDIEGIYEKMAKVQQK